MFEMSFCSCFDLKIDPTSKKASKIKDFCTLHVLKATSYPTTWETTLDLQLS